MASEEGLIAPGEAVGIAGGPIVEGVVTVRPDAEAAAAGRAGPDVLLMFSAPVEGSEETDL